MLLLKTLSLILLAAQAAAIDLKVNWLDGGEVRMRGSQIVTTYKIKPQHIDRLLELVKQDPEADAIHNDLLRMLGTDDQKALHKIVRLCGPSDGVVSGGLSTFLSSPYVGESGAHTLIATLEDLTSGRAPEEYLKDRVDAIRWNQRPAIVRATYLPDYVIVRADWGVDICLTPKESVADAYSMLVHEMFHLAYANRSVDRDMLRYADEEDYMYKTVLEPSDEVDAYIAGNRALVRLLKSRAALGAEDQKFFNDQGDFIGSRDEYAKIIVDVKKYRNDRFGPYTMQNLDTGETWTESEYLTNFNAIHSNEAGAYEAFASVLEKTKEKIAKRSSKAKTKKIVAELAALEARAARLEAELAVRKARLDKYDELIEKFERTGQFKFRSR